MQGITKIYEDFPGSTIIIHHCKSDGLSQPSVSINISVPTKYGACVFQKPISQILLDASPCGPAAMLDQFILQMYEEMYATVREAEERAECAMAAAEENDMEVAFVPIHDQPPEPEPDRVIGCWKCENSVKVGVKVDEHGQRSVDLDSPVFKDWYFTTDTGWLCPNCR